MAKLISASAIMMFAVFGCSRQAPTEAQSVPPSNAQAAFATDENPFPDSPTAAKSDAGRPMTHDEREFFNGLSGKLKIELTVPAKPIGNLMNLQASPEARVANLKLETEVFNRDTETFRPLTAEELDSVAFRASQIRLRGESGKDVTHQAPNREFFTVRDLLQAVEETERQTRDQSEWFGGVDVDHIFFEGIYPTEDGAWEIYWGS